MSKRQDGAVGNQSTKPTTIDAGEIDSNFLGDSKFDESDNQQITLCLKQASHNVSTVELNGQSVNNEVVAKSDQSEDSSDNEQIDQQSFLS